MLNGLKFVKNSESKLNKNNNSEYIIFMLCQVLS